MTRLHRISRHALAPVALAVSLGWAMPVMAQDVSDAEALRQELAAMRAQMDAMTNRIDSLEGQLVSAKAQADAASSAAATASAQVKEVAKGAPKVTWKGAPQIEGEGGWSFKPRGRLQIDAGAVSAPDAITDKSTGFGTELRRAYLGVEGTIPGGFGYRAEVDVAASSVEVTDLYLTYQASKQLTFTVGQHKALWGLEELTSDLFTSFTERAAINTAFGYERRVGLSAQYASGDVVLQGGVFSDNANDLNKDENNSIGFDGRAVFMPKLAGGQFHLGGSIHHRELNNGGTKVQYRVRPFIHTPDIRFADTGEITADSETGYGVELAYVRGPFHATGEAHWQTASVPGLADPTFFGGYAEVGYFLTKGDTRGYKGGVFDRIKPANGVDKGGPGAIQLNLRYDYLDLVDAGIVGGKQNGYLVSLVWTPTAYTRFMANYGRMEYDMAAIAAGTDTSYGVDAVGVRAQFDF